MNMRYLFLMCCIVFFILLFLLNGNSANAQEQKIYRFNLEFGTGLSTFKNVQGSSPYPAGNFTLAIKTPAERIISLEVFKTGEIYGGSWADSYQDYSLLYGKMLHLKKEGKGFVSFHGGAGYLKIFKKSNYENEYKKNTLGLTAQLNAGWDFEQGCISLIIFQKYSFSEGNNITGILLHYTISFPLYWTAK